MLRIRHEVDGRATALVAEETDRPVPGAGELLIRTRAIGVTLPTVRRLRDTGEPVTLGGEVAGEVAALGDGVTSFGIGDRVTGLCFADAYAEFAVLNTAMTTRIRTAPATWRRWRSSAAGWWRAVPTRPHTCGPASPSS